ncbi:MAG: Uma2 family endonuclease [Myxococcota bacterium]
METARIERMTYAEYCAFERHAELKHEYLGGEVYAMTGGTLEHARLGGRIIHLLTRELEGGPCRVLTSDARVRVEATDLDTYPDVSVVCGDVRTAAEDERALVNPTLVVEVLSDSTEAYDRGQKAAHYRRIPSLRAYLLVSQHQPHLELQLRPAAGPWVLLEAGPGEHLPIEPLELSLSVDEVYRVPTR